ncbi:putative uncharacterized protein [Pseudomonas sp. StFLB209]|uniref:hypothetical protein n=2 Tax=unclassified Pseudomonas TaxID=196821 RepID=UPI0004F74427|nr:hypothetical protein [Pseudomonas sp. StFLB209]BAP44938.1 putative uncharacterized protein [Pseudomonas sp. StFLB209]
MYPSYKGLMTVGLFLLFATLLQLACRLFLHLNKRPYNRRKTDPLVLMAQMMLAWLFANTWVGLFLDE